jgi:regulatory protein
MFSARRRRTGVAPADGATEVPSAPGFPGDDGGEDREVLDAAALKRIAVSHLARRDHSRAELRSRLLRRGADEDLVDRVLTELESERLLSDRRLAESLARSRDSRYGSQRMAHDLRVKGVGEEAAEVLASYRAGDLERAREVWARRFRSAPSNPAERAKQMRFLQARGFPADVIRQVVPRMAVGAGEDPSDD